jgi:beta-glucosidase
MMLMLTMNPCHTPLNGLKVISDCGEIRGLDSEANHGTSANPYTQQTNGSMSCQAALRGGCDMDCGSTFDAHMAEALAGGIVLPADVATAARRVIKPSIELGLLDGKHAPGATLGPEDIDTAASRQLALEAGQQGIVLLKNVPVNVTNAAAASGSDSTATATRVKLPTPSPPIPLLPLPKNAKVAIIGPASNFTTEMQSNYAGWNTVVLQQSPWAVLTAHPDINVVSSAAGAPYVEGADASLIPEAVAAATKADVVLMFVGTNPRGNVASCPNPPGKCVKTTEAEAVDRTDLKLPGVQSQLVKAVVAANSRTILVMINGGPLAIEWEAANIPAILECFFPGEMGGDAIASVLTGSVAPSGRLPYTMHGARFGRNSLSKGCHRFPRLLA